tara:strand:- start:559 stop:957 length:399 start_codon:yes stop_codon:yes gene_type:complete
MRALGVGDGAIVVGKDPWVLEWRRGGGCLSCFEVVFSPPRPLLAGSRDALEAPARPCVHVFQKTDALAVFDDFFERIPHGVPPLPLPLPRHALADPLSLAAGRSEPRPRADSPTQPPSPLRSRPTSTRSRTC